MEPSALSEGPELGEGGPGALERDEEGGVGLPLSPLGGGRVVLVPPSNHRRLKLWVHMATPVPILKRSSAVVLAAGHHSRHRHNGTVAEWGP